MHSNKAGSNRILFIDANDSFTNNIISLLETRLQATVSVWNISLQLQDAQLAAALHQYDAVVVGPGPGHPSHEVDTGIMNMLWKVEEQDLLPVLGICLGFQNLAFHHGASIERLKEPKHGMVCRISHRRGSIFEDVPQFRATCYHSLRVQLSPLRQGPCQSQEENVLWPPLEKCPDLHPLAWDLGDQVNGPVLMALRHVRKPFWGLQYHPESICTDEASIRVVENWWTAARDWNELRRQRRRQTHEGSSIQHLHPKVQSQIEGVEESYLQRRAFVWTPETEVGNSNCNGPQQFAKVITGVVQSKGLKLLELCTDLNFLRAEVVVLDSAVLRADTGQHTVIGLIVPDQTVKLEYDSTSRRIRRRGPDRDTVRHDSLSDHQGDVYLYLARYMENRRAVGGSAESPFWGGLMGYVTYETCLEAVSVAVAPSGLSSQASWNEPGMAFAFIERSLVYDHISGRLYVQSIRADDTGWVQETTEAVELLSRASPPSIKKGGLGLPRKISIPPIYDPVHLGMNGHSHSVHSPPLKLPCVPNGVSKNAGLQVTLPILEEYQDKVRQCQDSIRAGDSYELCLTTQAEVKISRRHLDPGYAWPLYLALRRHNPAPFGAYLRFGNATLLSCSPERFLRWDRTGLCQMRPIKGTVKKGPGVTQALAERILGEVKEQAENLMIVDLIRHDMHGVLGSGVVEVRSLMTVEEYETVFQLVSVIEGPTAAPVCSDTVLSLASASASSSDHAPPSTADGRRPSFFRQGLGLLAASLPPGSMTGAPKKRSCELLQHIEQGRRRGIYSGVVGYMCVSGAGDFSVVIRSAFRWGGHGGGGDGRQRRREPNPAAHVNGAHDTDIHHPTGRSRRRCDRDAVNGDGEEDGEKDRVRDEDEDQDGDEDIWRIGAGGAVTALSTPQGEWEEMQTKLNSTLVPLVRHLQQVLGGR
ncbi:MAG: para-aminobenzoate synthase, (PABA) [Phylliscum demangeonii]|nr:MAG: para-aminobenzoate synthase, (PABA) [Phylliscum demangeonii]